MTSWAASRWCWAWSRCCWRSTAFANFPPSGSRCYPPLAFAAFIFRESRAARPIIAVEILKQPGFALLNLVSVLANLAAFSVWLLVPYFLARVPAIA